jgi:hypothetical protein
MQSYNSSTLDKYVRKSRWIFSASGRQSWLWIGAVFRPTTISAWLWRAKMEPFA